MTPARQYLLIERKKRKQVVEDKEGARRLGQEKNIGPVLKTCQSHTIEYGVGKIGVGDGRSNHLV